MTSIYLQYKGQMLLLYRQGSRVVNNVWVGSAGGHFEENELNDPLQCVLREAQEELGVTENDLEGLSLRYITHRLVKGEIRQNYYFFARLKEERELSSNEGTLRWVPYDEVPALTMPVSAKHMILHYLSAGRFDDRTYCGITEEAGTYFVPMADFEG